MASGVHFTSRRGQAATTPFGRVLAQTQAIISQDSGRRHLPLGLSLLPAGLQRALQKPYMVLSEAFRRERLDLQIDPAVFEDYLWMRLFDSTLPPSDRAILHRAEYFATELGHEYARSLSMLPRPFQRRIDTVGWDLFFGANVSPYRLAPGTSMMIRYYDALPLLSPHTIGQPWMHTHSHARMLQRNMQDGAWFYCDSEPVRGDLLRLFPEAEARVHTIPVTVSAELRPDVRPDRDLRTILSRRRSPETLPLLFLAVSTLEPRKNYLKLFSAFEAARGMTQRPIQLVVVANPGWRSDAELAELKRLVGEGAYHLSSVPAEELRVLYSMAHAVVAPSRAEGFDYSGVEGMACGTPVLASDIPVHRWVYGDAAEYFDAYDPQALARRIAAFADAPRDEGRLAALRDRGQRQAALYRPEALAPRWEAAINAQAAAPSQAGA
jgi:glycosyltransferase involved in cell wall biosynthesis